MGVNGGEVLVEARGAWFVMGCELVCLRAFVWDVHACVCVCVRV